MSRKVLVLVGAAGLLLVFATLGVWWQRAGSGDAGRERPAAVRTTSPPRPYLRLTVSRDASTGQVGIRRASLVETAILPLTGAGGYYAVLDGSRGVLSAMPFAFGREAVEESAGDGAIVQRAVRLSAQSVIVFLPYPAGGTGVRVLDIQGKLVAALDRDALSRVTSRQAGSASSDIWPPLLSTVTASVHAASPLADLQAAFPHILFATDIQDLSSYHQNSDVVTVVPMDSWATTLQDTLTDMSPLLLGSVGSIALVEFAGHGVGTNVVCPGKPLTTIKRGSTVGNQIVINVSDLVSGSVVPNNPAQLRETLVHESVHAFNNLVDGSVNGEEHLPVDVQTKVDDIRENLGHIFGAFSKTWTQIQGSAKVAYSGYGNYQGANALCTYTSVTSAVQAGFAAPYGGTNAKEDAATYVQLFFDSTQSAAAHPVCQQFAGLTNQIPRDKLLAFAKLNFLRGLEIIDESDYASCVQSADPADQRGFHVGNGNYTQGLKADTIDQPPGIVQAVPGSRFVVLGATSTARAMLQIYARPPFYTPIGFHRLDKTAGWLTPYVGMKGLKRRNLLTWQPTNISNQTQLTRTTRLSSGGFALVVNNLPGRIKGYAFFVPLEDWLGRQTTTLDLVWFRDY